MKFKKQRIISIIAVVTMAIVLSFVFVACNKTDSPDAPKKEFTITFDTQGGSEVKSIKIEEGKSATLPNPPTKEDCTFAGWYLDSNYEQSFDETCAIYKDYVLYAKWEKIDDGLSIISSEFFDIDENVLTMKKSAFLSATETTFDLRNKFTINDNSRWRCFTSVNCTPSNEISTCIIDVSYGWNKIYALVENQLTSKKKIYEVEVYKYPFVAYNTLNDGSLEIVSVSDCVDVKFPDSITERITSIGYSAFESCPSLQTIQDLPKIKTIKDNAFASCKNLTNITISDSVNSIGDSVFSGCSSLESITIPFVGTKSGVTSSDKNQYPFGYIFGTSSYDGGVATKQYYYGDSTSSTTSATYYIPSSLKSVTVTGGNILYGAFRNCTGLTSITIPNSVTSIGERAFNGCSGLTSVTIPDSVTGIGEGAFAYCYGLINITIPNSVTSIGNWAFNRCSGITSITIPDSVTSIGEYVFSGCTGLTSVTIPDSVTSIGAGAFSGCTGLTSVTIPDSVTSIDDGAFNGCSGLTSVTIPDSVTNIGLLFAGCSGLMSLNVEKGNKKYHSVNNCLIETESKTLLSGCKNSIIPADGSVTSIGSAAFSGCTGLTSVTIPDSVTSIGSSAFSGCTGLTSITIPASVTSIDDYTFSNCTNLAIITIPNGVTSIGFNAFTGCTSLTSVIIPNSVTEIKSDAFEDCTSLTSIVIPNGVTTINPFTFYGCAALTNVTLPNSITEIGWKSFSKCTGLKSITIPNSVEFIITDAFSGCTGLTSITIPDSVKSIGKYAFSGCTGLTSIKFNGTIAQWNAISKGYDWKYNVPATKVVCKDGTISI